MRDDLDELPGMLAELRELIREGHAVIKDMDRLKRDLREIVNSAALSARKQAQAAANEEMQRFQRHAQREMDRSARDLNRSVEAARGQIVKALTVESIEEIPGGGLRAKFRGNLFDDGST